MDDNAADNVNRHWKFVDIGTGWYKIVSKEGTCLDSFGPNNIGISSAGISSAGY